MLKKGQWGQKGVLTQPLFGKPHFEEGRRHIDMSLSQTVTSLYGPIFFSPRKCVTSVRKPYYKHASFCQKSVTQPKEVSKCRFWNQAFIKWVISKVCHFAINTSKSLMRNRSFWYFMGQISSGSSQIMLCFLDCWLRNS